MDRETVMSGGRALARLVVGGIWLAAAIALVASGSILIGLLALCYVAYLWFFGGRLLIY